MKPLRCLLLLALTPFLFCCSDDNDNNPYLDEEFLKQTSWSGTLTESYYGGGKTERYDIGLSFYTGDQGEYGLKRGDGTTSGKSFTYSIDQRMLHFEGWGCEISGYWLVVERKGNKLVVETGTEESYKAILSLTKNY